MFIVLSDKQMVELKSVRIEDRKLYINGDSIYGYSEEALRKIFDTIVNYIEAEKTVYFLPKPSFGRKI